MGEFEEFVRSKNTLGEVHQVLQHPGLHETIKDFMGRPILVLCDRFKAMCIKQEPIRIGFPVTDDDLRDMLEQTCVIEPNIESEYNVTTKDIEKSPPLQKNLVHIVLQQTMYFKSKNTLIKLFLV